MLQMTGISSFSFKYNR